MIVFVTGSSRVSVSYIAWNSWTLPAVEFGSSVLPGFTTAGVIFPDLTVSAGALAVGADAAGAGAAGAVEAASSSSSSQPITAAVARPTPPSAAPRRKPRRVTF